MFFSLQFQTVYTSVILNFLVFTSSCLLKRYFFQFCYLENFKGQATVCRAHIHIYVFMWVFLLSLLDTEKKLSTGQCENTLEETLLKVFFMYFDVLG